MELLRHLVNVREAGYLFLDEGWLDDIKPYTQTVTISAYQFCLFAKG